MFSVLVLGIMMLLIPSSSLANAQEYDDYYYEDEQYYDGIYRDDDYNKKSDYENDEQYKKKEDKTDEPIIIIKNEPIIKKDHKKKMKEPPMLIVKKDVLYCDSFSGVSDQRCIDPIPNKNSDRWLQTCALDNEVCENIDDEFFKMIVTDDIEFPGSEDGTKLNLNGERYTVTEKGNNGQEDNLVPLPLLCEEAGFDKGFLLDENIIICTEFEGECSGILKKGELKECTVENYVVGTIATAKLTVNKEIYGCDNIESNGRIMNCEDLSHDDNWLLCDDIVANVFCNSLQENEFDIEVSDSNNNLINPPGQFEGSIDGTMIMDLEPGTYNVTEVRHSGSGNVLGVDNGQTIVCINAGFVNGGFFFNTQPLSDYQICFEYEDENGNDCSLIDLEAGDDKTCTVKNYIHLGRIL